MININELKERIKGFNETYAFEVEKKEVGKKTFETYFIKNLSTGSGSNYIRVTSPLSYWVPPALKNWFQNNTKEAADKKLVEASNAGSEIHKHIELCHGDISKLPTVDDPQVQNGINAFKEFWSSQSLEIVAQEQRVFSTKYGVAGTIDMLAVSGNDLVVIDWKSGTFYKPTYGWQLAMYGQCVEELFGVRPKLKVIMLDKRTGKASTINFEHNDFLLSCYLGVLQAFSGENWKALGEFWPWNLNQLMGGKNAI